MMQNEKGLVINVIIEWSFMKKVYRRVRKRPDTAIWAGLVTFFTSMISMGAINKYDLHAYEEFIAAFIVSAAAAGTVYGRQRLYQAEKNGEKVISTDLDDELEG